MLSADWLFSNHSTHLVVIKLLTAKLDEIDEMRNRSCSEQNKDIETWSVARPVLDGMPTGTSQSSRTERIVIKNEDIYSDKAYARKQEELRQYQWYVQLYTLLVETFTAKEKWFVDQHYNQQLTLVAMTSLPDSPFYGCDRSTVWKFKKRLLTKADAILSSV